MALHDFTMQQWWMESLTAKIIAFSLELPEFCFFFSFFKRLSTERCRLHHYADNASPQVAVSFHSRDCIQQVQLNTGEKWLNLTKMCAFIRYISVRCYSYEVEGGKHHLICFEGENIKSIFEGNLKILMWLYNLTKDIVI